MSIKFSARDRAQTLFTESQSLFNAFFNEDFIDFSSTEHEELAKRVKDLCEALYALPRSRTEIGLDEQRCLDVFNSLTIGLSATVSEIGTEFGRASDFDGRKQDGLQRAVKKTQYRELPEVLRYFVYALRLLPKVWNR
jgi:hypothetical protein